MIYKRPIWYSRHIRTGGFYATTLHFLKSVYGQHGRKNFPFSSTGWETLNIRSIQRTYMSSVVAGTPFSPSAAGLKYRFWPTTSWSAAEVVSSISVKKEKGSPSSVSPAGRTSLGSSA